MTSASVQAAVYVREKQRLRLNKKNNLNKGRFELPTHIATRDIAPFPTYPPQTWGKSPSAWLEREKKGEFSPCIDIEPSLIGHGKLKISDAHRKWSKKNNKLHEPSFGGSSSDDLRGGLHRQYDAAANMLLYIGLCAVALGLVIAFVGTGEKGFKTVQLRLIGPTMIGCGSFCCFLRILFCFCPTRCMRKRFKHRHKNQCGGMAGAIPLSEHRLISDPRARLEYYKHLPFHGQVTRNFLLYDEMQQQTAAAKSTGAIKKRVSIKNENHVIDDAASDSLSTLRELSPLHEEDLIDFQQSSNSFENLPSLDSSLEYLHEQLKDDVVPSTAKEPMFNTEEQLQQLRSTLTFRDSTDQFADSRLTISYDDFELQEDLKFGTKDTDKQQGKDEENPTLSQGLVLSAGMLEKKN
ncbi:hypothetical protein V9T40_011007 [Parthenolecanium corni]|uniref:Uncharacterized protein n=1 Tax=Parthenolecanium corni TaxID=536013 RepID=A0AAN9T683_9HEMI